jgi:hypothetical protein
MVALAPDSTLMRPVPLTAWPVPKLLMTHEFRTVTFFAAMTSPPVIFSPSITVLSVRIVRPEVLTSCVPGGYPLLLGPGQPAAIASWKLFEPPPGRERVEEGSFLRSNRLATNRKAAAAPQTLVSTLLMAPIAQPTIGLRG